MKAEQNESVNFYQNLGKLFYAIAAADAKVRAEELEALKTIVSKEWLTADAKFPIINTFRWLQSIDDYNADTCYTSFIDFKNAHESLFTKKIKRLILKTAGQIAASFSGVNKSELIMLANLSLEFKKQANEK